MPRSFQVFAGFIAFLVGLFIEETARRIPIFSRALGKEARSPRRFRDLLERLGGAFIKFGQFMSMRSDILPPAYCRALSTLFDRVPPFPAKEARAIVERELGKPIGDLFHEWSDDPVGAASFGQVHLVRLK